MASPTPGPAARWSRHASRVALLSNTVLIGALCYDQWRRRESPPSADEGAEDESARSPDADAKTANSDDLAALPRALKIVAAIVAPTTLLTGLLFYFGRIYANGTFGYFGVDFTALDLTVSDYLTRSADGLILPLLLAAVLTIVGLLFHQFIESLPLDTGGTTVRVVAVIAGLIGVVCTAFALVDLFGPPLFITHPYVSGVLLMLGTLLTAYAVRLIRKLVSSDNTTKRTVLVAVGEWTALLLLVSVGAFSAVGNYAGELGEMRARQIEASLATFPPVTIFSKEKLSLTAPGVREVPCSKDSAYKFRDEGLTLLQQSGNQYLLVPVGWKHDSGTAFLLPRNDGLRLEFNPAGQPLHSGC